MFSGTYLTFTCVFGAYLSCKASLAYAAQPLKNILHIFSFFAGRQAGLHAFVPPSGWKKARWRKIRRPQPLGGWDESSLTVILRLPRPACLPSSSRRWTRRVHALGGSICPIRSLRSCCRSLPKEREGKPQQRNTRHVLNSVRLRIDIQSRCSRARGYGCAVCPTRRWTRPILCRAGPIRSIRSPRTY
jgi:hypothetical protein